MALDKTSSLTTQFSIPCLRPWEETAVYDDKGKCVVPSGLGWRCELSYALDRDFSMLKYVMRHIRLNSFGYEKGNFHNAYSTVKKNKAFSHELIHAWLNIWGTTDTYVPMLYEPFYDGNAQAEALVIPMQDLILDKIIDGQPPESNFSLYQSSVDWNHQSKISKGQNSRNSSIVQLIRSGKNIPVYDWIRANKKSQQYPSDSEFETKLGESLIDPMDKDKLSIPTQAVGNFFNACRPLIESVVLTVDQLQNQIGKGDKPLSPRTIDMMLRTLKVREFHDIMHSGQPRAMTVSHVKWLKKIEQDGLLYAYDTKIANARKRPPVYTV
jgi:hypothetical protein